MNASVQQVFQCYTNPNNIEKAWPQDIVKGSESVWFKEWRRFRDESQRGIYGKEDEMILEVSDKEQNRRLVTEQKEGPFKSWDNNARI